MTFAAGKNVYEKLSISIEFIELSMFFLDLPMHQSDIFRMFFCYYKKTKLAIRTKWKMNHTC